MKNPPAEDTTYRSRFSDTAVIADMDLRILNFYNSTYWRYFCIFVTEFPKIILNILIYTISALQCLI